MEHSCNIEMLLVSEKYIFIEIKVIMDNMHCWVSLMELMIGN